MANTCKGCGRKILWARTDDGRAIPLDAVAPVYEVATVESAERGDTLVARRATDSFVSHFVTCPNRQQFSKKNNFGGKPPASDEVW